MAVVLLPSEHARASPYSARNPQEGPLVLTEKQSNELCKLVTGTQRYPTPGTPGMGIARSKVDEKIYLFSLDDQVLY
jgi:hypothetical protein